MELPQLLVVVALVAIWAMSVYLLLAWWRERHVVSKEGLRIGRLLRAPLFLPWSQVREVRYSGVLGWFRIETIGRPVAHVRVRADGLPSFAGTALRHTGDAALDTRTRFVLEAIAMGCSRQVWSPGAGQEWMRALQARGSPRFAARLAWLQRKARSLRADPAPASDVATLEFRVDKLVDEKWTPGPANDLPPGETPPGFEGYRKSSALLSVMAMDPAGVVVGIMIGPVCEHSTEPAGVIVKANEVNEPWKDTALKVLLLKHYQAAARALGYAKIDLTQIMVRDVAPPGRAPAPGAGT